MSNDDLTRDIPDSESAGITQPMITAVFRLLSEIKIQVESLGARLGAVETRLDGIDTRLDGIDTRLGGIDTRLGGIETRLDAIETRLGAVETRLDGIDTRLGAVETRIDNLESRLARDIEGLNARMTKGFSEISNKIDALNRSRLQTEADYFGLLQRVSELESKAS